MKNISCSILCSKTPTNYKLKEVLTPDRAGDTFKNSFDNVLDNHNVSNYNVSDIEQNAGNDNLKVNKETSNASNTNFIK